MNLQHAGQPRSLANGYGRRRVEKESVGRPEHKWQYGKTNVSKLTNAGVVAGSKGGYESPSRERLVYSTTCLIGLNVEVQVKDGSLFSGIFHATDAEEDFGIILKMARQIRTISSRVDNTSKGPSKILIIPSKELVQIIAKGVPVTREGLINEMQRVKQQEIMLDSSISQSRHVDVERELERWVPDEDDPQCPELENIFDGPWRNRGWDQFEANEALFGVKSTFDEDLYTTKLERGPQMRELEREALRIAREIEGEETQDLHLAEERGAHFHENFDIDEETKYSSVFRGVDDSGYDEDEDILLDSQNSETFGGASSSVVSKPFANLTEEKSNHGVQVSSCPSTMEEEQSSLSSTARDLHRFGSNDNSREMSSQFRSKTSALESESSFRVQKHQFNEPHAGNTCVEEFGEKLTLTEVAQTSEFEGEPLPSLGGCIITEEAKTSKSQNLPSSLVAEKDGSDIGAVLPNYTSNPFTPLELNKAQEKTSCPSAHTENAAPMKAQGATQSAKPRGRPGSSTSSTSESGRAPSAPNGPGLSPSSSVGSLSSEKSTLNPHAKEFKLNPNAKSFIPTQTPLRPASPVSDGPFYFPPNVSAVPHMHGMPVGVGVGPSYPHQPVIYNPQAAPMQSPQAYFHPNGPQYGQQMIFGHPRPVLYMQTYSPEMQYKGRDF